MGKGAQMGVFLYEEENSIIEQVYVHAEAEIIGMSFLVYRIILFKEMEYFLKYILTKTIKLRTINLTKTN